MCYLYADTPLFDARGYVFITDFYCQSYYRWCIIVNSIHYVSLMIKERVQLNNG